MRQLYLILHDIRSCHNVGSLLRTAEGLGVAHVYFTGYTPYPLHAADQRLPHIAQKLDKQIHKTALGAEHMVPWSIVPDVEALIPALQSQSISVLGLEQSSTSVSLPTYKPPANVAVLLGREVEGIAGHLLSLTDTTLEIPMYGRKESFNVVQAAAMTLYHLRFAPE